MKKLVPYIVSFLLLFPLLAYGQEDIFQVKTPNVMIIFDTSSSMDMRPDGTSVGASNVQVDSSGKVVTSGGNTYLFEGGANHPSSKLYQAKLALKEVIDEVVKDRVNLGFATYAQTKREIRRGYYKRDRHFYLNPRWRWDKRYWKFYSDRHTYTTKSKESNSFKDYNNTTHTGVGVNYEFSIPHAATNSPGNNGVNEPPPFPPGTYNLNLTHTVISITYNAEYNEYTYTYRTNWHDHYSIVWKSVYKPNSNPIVCTGDFPRNWGDGYITYWPGDSNYDANPTLWQCYGPTAEGYDYWAKEWTWIQFNDASSCQLEYGSDNLGDPSPNNQYSRWYLVDPFDTAIPSGSVIATRKTCYDYSDYKYITNVGPNRPHQWSYFKTVGGNCNPIQDVGCNWPESQQMPNYYPSKDGGGNFNNNPGTFDNHHFFVNFPNDKDPAFTPAVRTGIRGQVMSFLDLAPVQSPESGRYWTRLPLHTSYNRTGLTSNTVESFHTPLADSLKYGFKYFYDYIYNYNGGDTASQQSAGGVLCRGNYIILLTDGLESARLSGGLPDYAAAATEAANLRTVNVKTFVIGFGTDLQGNLTLQNIAVSGGTEKAYFAVDLPSLKISLESIFQAILGATYGRSNPVITKSGDRIFKGFFEFTSDSSWKGGLYAYDVDKATGGVIVPQVWDAGDKLTNEGRGTIWTWKDDILNPGREMFARNNSNLYSLVNPANEDINGDLSLTDLDAQTVIDYTLEPRHGYYSVPNPSPPPDNKWVFPYKGQRPVAGTHPVEPKGWKLGDIYHSTPVFVAAPPFGFAENDYSTFYQKYRNRNQMVYVGANDGMLHGIKNTKGTTSTDGREHIAIIPKNLLGKVRNLRSTHDYYVDATPKAYDVFFSGLTTEDWKKWRTVIINSQRDGGPYYFAVDVTNPDGYSYGPEYPRILWEWTDPNMGNSWAKPDVGKINDGGTIKYVAFITGGYSVGSNIGNSFYIIDIETGTTLKNWVNLGPLGTDDNKIPSGPTAFDANSDGLVDYIYFGDTKGTLWKVNVTSTNKNSWSCDPLYTPPLAQRKPIFYSPTVVKNNEGKILVFFGTGEELNLLTVTDNYFWEVWDNNGIGSTIGPNWPKVLTGQKVLSSPVVANYVVYFTSWHYTASSEYCGAGSGRLYGFKISNAGVEGGVAGLVTLDIHGYPEPVKEYVTIGPGIPTSPVVTNGNIYVSSSVDAKNIIRIRFLGWPAARTRSWREVF